MPSPIDLNYIFLTPEDLLNVDSTLTLHNLHL